MIIQLHVTNWLCHKEIKLNFISGLNLLFGDNGTGKTSIIRAIFMGLFGECPAFKNLDKSQLILHGENVAVIRIQFLKSQSDTNSFLVERTITENRLSSEIFFMENHTEKKTLKRGNKPVTEFIIDTLGIKNNMYKLIFFGEGEMGQYLYSNRTFRKNLTQKILNIENAEKILRAISKIKNINRNRIKDLKTRNFDYQMQIKKFPERIENLSELLEKKENLENKITNLQTKLEGMSDDSQVKRFERIRNQISMYEQETSEDYREVEILNRGLKSKLNRINLYKKDISSFNQSQEDVLININIKIKEIDKYIARQEQDRNRLLIESDFVSTQLKLFNLGGDFPQSKCPTCDQPISKEYRFIRYKNLQDDFDKKKRDIEYFSKLLLSKSKIITKLKRDRELLTLKISEQKEIEQLEEKIASVKSRIRDKLILIKDLELELEDNTQGTDKSRSLQKQLSIHQQEVDQLDRQITAIQNLETTFFSINDEIDRNIKIITDLENSMKFLELLKEGTEDVYNKIASTLISEVKPILSEKIKTLSDFQIEISDIDSKFLFPIVKIAGNERNFQNLSGGEKLITYLAFRLSLLEVYGRSSFFLIDDPSDNLDSAHCIELLDDIQTIISPPDNPLKQVIVATNDIRFSGPISPEIETPWKKLYVLKKQKNEENEQIYTHEEIEYNPTEIPSPYWEKFPYTNIEEQLENGFKESILTRFSEDSRDDFLFKQFHITAFVDILGEYNIDYIKVIDPQQRNLDFVIIKNSNRIGVVLKSTSIIEEEYYLDLNQVFNIKNALSRLNLNGLLYSIYFNKESFWKAYYFSKDDLEGPLSEENIGPAQDLESYLK